MTSIRQIAILGCGWLGFPLAQQLLQAGYSIKGSTTRAEKMPSLPAAGIKPFLIRVGTEIAGTDLPDFFDADLLVLNLPPGGRSNPEAAQQHPAQIAAILAQANQSPRLKKLLFISSTGVYGRANGKVTEETPLQPDTASGKALAAVEALLLSQNQWETTLLRMAGLAGGSRHPGRFLAGKTAVPAPHAPVNLVHLDDCLAVIRHIIEQQVWGELFNVCADEHPTKEAFYTGQAQKLGLTPPVFSYTDGGSNQKWIANERLKSRLGYTFLHPDPMHF